MAIDPSLLGWMLDSDPALRWQVERDLAGAPPVVWEATRARIATEGFGARLLAKQDRDGQWAGGAYFPGGGNGAASDAPDPEPPEAEGQPWTATTWTLNTLRDWGLDAAVLAGTAELLAANSRWSTTTCRTGAARSTVASTASPSPTGCGSGRTSPRWPGGSSITSWPTAGGTVNGSRARPARRSTPPSIR